jgi:hypothetical protein
MCDSVRSAVVTVVSWLAGITDNNGESPCGASVTYARDLNAICNLSATMPPVMLELYLTTP